VIFHYLGVLNENYLFVVHGKKENHLCKEPNTFCQIMFFVLTCLLMLVPIECLHVMVLFIYLFIDVGPL